MSDTRGNAHFSGKSQKSLSKSKELPRLRRSKRLENWSRTKERTRRERKQGPGRPFEHLLNRDRARGAADAYLVQNVSPNPRYAKDPTEIHVIKRRPSEGLKTFIDRFKSESSHIKGVPPVLRISSFMHGHGYPKLEKKLNEKLPKMDQGNTRPVWSIGQEKDRNRSGPRELRRNMGMYTPYSRRDTFTHSLKFEGILAEEADRRSHSLKKVSSSGKRHPPEQSEERKPRKEWRESHKHDKWWKKAQETIQSLKDSRRQRFLRRSIPSLGFGRPSIDHGRGRKKQDCANGIRNSKVSFTIKCHNGKNRDEKSWSGGFDHPFYDQVPDGPRSRYNGNK
ncbi:hypothetical protein Tco_0393018 [Tanacetum coccineum]